jgi:hypothetical protein
MQEFRVFILDFLKPGEHTNTERGYLSAVLKPELEKKLKVETSEEGEPIEVVVSKVDQDPLVIV